MVLAVDAEVIVVGAGPVGGLAARQLARAGIRVLLLEEHGQVGRPVHCAGLIGIAGLHGLGVHPSPDVVATKVRRSIFHSPSGHTLIFEKERPHAYVLHRDLLDQQIVREAEAAGALLSTNSRVTQCRQAAGEIRVSVRHKGGLREYRARVVVDAEGIGARLARQQGLPGPKPRYVLRALQYEVSNVSLPTDTVHLFFDTRLALHFFAWIIPLSNHRARVGLATARCRVRLALDKFLASNRLLRGARVERRLGGLVYTGGPSGRTVRGRFVAVGDAAGQTKATTGGGVVTGGGCALLAASCIGRALEGGKYHRRDLERYEGLWRRAWGRQLRQMALLRRFANSLTNAEMDRLFLALRRVNVRRLVEARGDIDQQGRLITSAVASPPLLAVALRILLAKAGRLPWLLRG